MSLWTGSFVNQTETSATSVVWLHGERLKDSNEKHTAQQV